MRNRWVDPGQGRDREVRRRNVTREAQTRMARELLTGSTRRVAAVSVLAVILIATAVCLTIWRYQVAVSGWDSANDKQTDVTGATALSAGLGREREAMNEYLLTPSSSLFLEIKTLRAQFARIAAAVTPETPAERAELHQAVARNSALASEFAGVASGGGSHPRAALASLDGYATQVVTAVNALNRMESAGAAAGEN